MGVPVARTPSAWGPFRAWSRPEATSWNLARLSARLVDMKSLPLSEAKDQLSGLVEDAELTHEIVTITKHGRPAAVLMGVDDYESLQETLFWLSQPGVYESIAEANGELSDGKAAAGEDVLARLRRDAG